MAPEYLRCVVAICQAVHHGGGAHAAAVAGVRAEAGERHRAQIPQFVRCRLYCDAELEMSRVKSERYRRAILRPHSARGGKNEELLSQQIRGLPAHGGIHRETKDVSARLLDQHFTGERQLALRAVGGCLEAHQIGISRLAYHLIQCHFNRVVPSGYGPVSCHL